MNDKYITVTQLTRYIKYKIDNDVNLNEVFLKGEISNFKAHSRGHFYFTLKDENSRINAIMFSSQTSKIKFMPEDGMKVLVTGKISVFEANGAYQIYVSDMLEDGVGNLYIAFEQLKKKLEEEGLFKDLITYSGDNDKSDYYLFFSYKSKNTGELNKKSKTKHALELIKNIYENL